jgi:hypothetical protein
VHAFINELERPVGTHLYGRRMYETMVAWEYPDAFAQEPVTQDFAAIWQAADKIVYSKSRETVSAPKTRLEREFHPQVVRELQAQSPLDLSGGWSDPRRLRDPDRARRRVSSARRAYYAWRSHAGPARQRTHRAGSRRRAPFY